MILRFKYDGFRSSGWYELTDWSGKVTGSIFIKLRWLIAPAEETYVAAKIQGDWRTKRVVELNRQRALELDKRKRDLKKMNLSLGYQSTTTKKVKKAKLLQKVGKCFQVTVLECRDLKNMRPALRGLNDVYVTVDIDGQTMDTSTVDSGGRFPRWGGGGGELLIYEPAMQPIRMTVRAFDKATALAETMLIGAAMHMGHMGEDDEIGAHNAMIGTLPIVAKARRNDQAEKNNQNKSSTHTTAGTRSTTTGTRSTTPGTRSTTTTTTTTTTTSDGQGEGFNDHMDALMLEYNRQGHRSDAAATANRRQLIAQRQSTAIDDDQVVDAILADICIAVNAVSVAQKLSSKAGRDWSAYEWLPLTDHKGKHSGDVRVVSRSNHRPLHVHTSSSLIHFVWQIDCVVILILIADCCIVWLSFQFMQWGAPPAPPPSASGELDVEEIIHGSTLASESQWQIDATIIECAQLTNMAKLGTCSTQQHPTFIHKIRTVCGYNLSCLLEQEQLNCCLCLVPTTNLH